MKFKYIKKDMRDTAAYNILAGLNTGDVIELEGRFAKKALTNPDFKKVGDNSKVSITHEESVILRDKKDAQRMADSGQRDARIRELQREIQALKEQAIVRQEEGISVDDVFLDDTPLDEV